MTSHGQFTLFSRQEFADKLVLNSGKENDDDLRSEAGTSAPELARAVLRQLPDADVSWVNHVARSAVRLSRRAPDSPPVAG